MSLAARQEDRLQESVEPHKLQPPPDLARGSTRVTIVWRNRVSATLVASNSHDRSTTCFFKPNLLRRHTD